MYPWELKKFIEERDYYLGGDDLLKAISVQENPQLKKVQFFAADNKYFMQDKEGNYYVFGAMPYEEAKGKGLVKKKEIR